MAGDSRHTSFQLLQFTVPGMPHVDLALPLPQVLEVGDLPPVTPLAFTPVFVRGVCRWRGQLITVIDLAALLCDQRPTTGGSYLEDRDIAYRAVIAQVVVEQRIELVAWPIFVGAKTITVPPQLEQASPLDGIASWLVFSTVVMEKPLTVLKVDQMVVSFSSS